MSTNQLSLNGASSHEPVVSLGVGNTSLTKSESRVHQVASTAITSSTTNVDRTFTANASRLVGTVLYGVAKIIEKLVTVAFILVVMFLIAALL